MTTDAQLYLVVETGPQAAENLAAALGEGAIASVLIAPGTDDPLDAASARPLVECAQSAGVAALILNDAALARALRADGVHLDPGKDPAGRYGLAREVLGNRYIVGANAGKSRHDAMTLGEAGADYIAFGAPPELRDRAGAEARRNELIAWWSELFEIPCVALDVETSAAAAELAGAGADFVACSLGAGLSPRAAAERVASFCQHLKSDHAETAS